MKKNMLAVAAAALLLASGSAMAQGYVGASFGPTSFDVDCTGTSKCEDSDTGYKVYGGYSFGNGFALEANYFDFGKVTATVPLYPYGNLDAEFHGTAVGVGLAATADFTHVFSGTFRMGVSQNKMRVKVRMSSLSGSDSESNTKPYVGLALGLRVTGGLSITGGVDFTEFESEGEKFDARLFSVGLKYQF